MSGGTRTIELTPRERRFVEEFLVDLNGTKAAIRAAYSEKTARQQASRLLSKVNVQAAIAAAQAERAERTNITKDEVLRHFWELATADPSELIEYRRDCCRYCWGEGFRWQETQGERDAREAAWRAEWVKVRMSGDRKALEEFGGFAELGGVGFDARKLPHPDCPECFGEGQGRVVIHDSRKVKGAARRLFSGVKVTRDGIQVLMRSQDGALSHLFDHLGLSAPRRSEVAGPGGGPVEVAEVGEELAALPREKRAQLRELLARAMTGGGDGGA